MVRARAASLFAIVASVLSAAGASSPGVAGDPDARGGADWPRWRGPQGDGVWYGPELPPKWPDAGLRVAWKIPVGGGYSGVAVAGGRVYTMDRREDPDEVERVFCVDARTGKTVWTHSQPVEYGNLSYGSGPRSTPTIHDGRVYTLGALGRLDCLDAKDGSPAWSVHLVDDLNGRLSEWGFAASPVIFENLVIVAPGAKEDGGIVALDRLTGETVWKSVGDEAGYCTPILVERPGGTLLVWWTPTHVRGLDVKTGRSLWSVPYKVTYGVSIATPIHADGIVIVSGYWEGTKAIRLGEKLADAELLWEENKYLRGLMSQPLHFDGHVYLLDKARGLTCFELKTGEKLWDDKNKLTPRGRNPQATLVRLGESNRVVALNSDGDLILGRLSPEGYVEESRTKIIGETWAHPAYAGRHVYARNDQELVCVSLFEAKR